MNKPTSDSPEEIPQRPDSAHAPEMERDRAEKEVQSPLSHDAEFGFDLDDVDWLRRLRDYQDPHSLGMLGPYLLLTEAGRGGQGVVYKARQPQTGRVIAVKRLLAGAFASREMRTRFVREVEAAAALDHPGIVTVFASDIVDGQTVLAMQWIEGQPVDRWAAGAQNARRTPAEVLGLFAKICHAVHHAHQRGVIHRDLKPSNVLIDADCEPHVLDFGLARILSPLSVDSIFTSHTTGFVGTPAYASPEHFSTLSNAVDVCSDVYSIGAMLYQALTGSPPFGDSHRFAELARAVEEVDPRRPSQLKPGLGREIDAIVLKAMAKSKVERYQSMDAFSCDIQRYLSGQPVLAHPRGAVYQLGKFIRRHKLAVVSTISFIVLITAFAVTASIFAMREHAARLDADWNSYVASISAASAAIRANDAASAQQELDRAPSHLRDWEWRYFSRQADGSVRSTRHDATCVAINNEGEVIDSVPRPEQSGFGIDGSQERATTLTRTHYRREDLSVGFRWALHYPGKLINLSSGRQVGDWPFPTSYGTLFAPNERMLALADQRGQLKLITLPEGVQEQGDTGATEVHIELATNDLKLFAEPIEGLAFRGDSRQLAASAGDGTIVIVDVSTAQVVDKVLGNGSPVWAVAFSPDGRKLATGSWDKTVALWDLDTKNVLWRSTGHRELISALAFSPDGSRLASGSWDKTIRVWNTAEGESIAHLVGHAHEVGTVDFLGGNDKLASFDADGYLKTWNLTPGDHSVAVGPFRRIEGIAGSPGSIRGGWIAVAEGQDASWRNARLSLIDYRRRTKCRELWTDETEGTSSGLFCASASSDGRWLAAGTSNGTILVWRGEELAAVVNDPESTLPQPAIRLDIEDPTNCTTVVSTSWTGNSNVKDSACLPIQLSFTEDGHRLAVSRLGGGIDILDLESRTNALNLHSGPVSDNPRTCVFLANGERLAVVRKKGGMMILDSRDGHLIAERQTSPDKGFSPHLTLNPAGDLIPVIYGNDVELINARNLTVVCRLSGHQRPVSAVSFSPDGRRLVSASFDNTLKLWDVATGREIATLHGHEFRATSVLFLDDGATIVSGGHDNQIRFWDTLIPGSNAPETSVIHPSR